MDVLHGLALRDHHALGERGGAVVSSAPLFQLVWDVGMDSPRSEENKRVVLGLDVPTASALDVVEHLSVDLQLAEVERLISATTRCSSLTVTPL